MVVHARVQAFAPVAAGGIGGDGQDGNVRQVVVPAADPRRGLVAVHFRHAHVHEHQVVVPPLEHGQGLVPVLRHVHVDIDAAQQVADDDLVEAVVLRHQGVQSEAGQFFGQGVVVDHRRGSDAGRQGQIDGEGRTPVHRGLHADVAVHHAGQLAADGQTQARAAVLAGGAVVGLLELVEDRRQPLDRDADARVGDGHGDVAGRVARVDHATDPDLARLGELDGVAHQVEGDLADAGGIAPEVAVGVGREVEDQIQVPGLGGGTQQGLDVLQQAVQVEGHALQGQAVGGDLGVVQDVVDDVQQRFHRTRDDLQVLPLLIAQFGVLQGLGHAQHAVHGSADLVAHGGQELVLGLVRQPGLGQGHLQFLHLLQASQHDLVEGRQDEHSQQEPESHLPVLGPVAAGQDHGPEPDGPQDLGPGQEVGPETDAVADDDPQEDGIEGRHVLPAQVQEYGHDPQIRHHGHVAPPRPAVGEAAHEFDPEVGKDHVGQDGHHAPGKEVGPVHCPVVAHCGEHQEGDPAHGHPGQALGSLFVDCPDHGHGRRNLARMRASGFYRFTAVYSAESAIHVGKSGGNLDNPLSHV